MRKIECPKIVENRWKNIISKSIDNESKIAMICLIESAKRQTDTFVRKMIFYDLANLKQ